MWNKNSKVFLWWSDTVLIETDLKKIDIEWCAFKILRICFFFKKITTKVASCRRKQVSFTFGEVLHIYSNLMNHIVCLVTFFKISETYLKRIEIKCCACKNCKKLCLLQKNTKKLLRLVWIYFGKLSVISLNQITNEVVLCVLCEQKQVSPSLLKVSGFVWIRGYQ